MLRSECIIGAKIKLTSGGFIPTRSFPMVGSEYECEGTLECTFDDYQQTRVLWDNGRSNTLRTAYFTPVKSKQYKSIW